MVREVVAVIGAGGMGATIARRVGVGRDVVLADSDPTALHAVADAMTDDGFAVEAHLVDVTDPSSVTSLAETAARRGPVTAVVHTAGVSPTGASVKAILCVDLVGTAHVLDAFGAVVGPCGAGVVIASMAGTILASALSAEDETLLTVTPAADLLGIPSVQALLDGAQDDAGQRSLAYGIAKRANQLRVRASAGRWGERGARINSISPGVIATAMGRAELADPATGQMVTAMIAGSPAQRVGTTTDIAAISEFLLSPAAGLITGTDVLADGGVVASILTPQLTAPA